MDFTRLVARLLRLRDKLERVIHQMMHYLYADRYTMGYHAFVDTLIGEHERISAELRTLESKLGLAPNQLPDDATLFYARKHLKQA